MANSDPRSKVDRLIDGGQPFEAARELESLWASDPLSAAFVGSRYKRIGPHLGMTPCKVAFERSFTIEPLLPVCRAACLVSGIDIDIHLGPFNSYAQEILEPQSGLYRFSPDAVFLSVLTSDVAPELWAGSIQNAEVSEGVVQRVVGHFSHLIETFRAHSAAHLIIHLLEQPASPNRGVLDTQLSASQLASIRRINDDVRRVARGHRGVFTLDYDGLVSRHGRLNWRDEVKWQVARMPIKAAFHRSLAQEWLRFLYPITGKIAKVAVVDLDNTLWGGVIGEDGLAGIKLGKEPPGVAYRSLQQALLELRDRGLLLAICSKNNAEDAKEVFDQHPEMLLKLKDFSAVKINWLEKSENLQAIASELNIGLDSVALIDDNPVERQQVHSTLPEVYVLELPGNPIQYVDAVLTYPPFERLVLSQEDRERSGYYAAQQQVSELKLKSLTKEEFYNSLQQRVIIDAVTNLTIARVAQLTMKTNQFNIATRRYSEQEILQFVGDAAWRTYTVRVIDRYADNGLVGVAFTHDSQDRCIIDTFLMSCRVISRGIETALLSYVVQDARDRGIRFLTGTFIPTKKNQPARSFFADHGFTLLEDRSDFSTWQLDMRETKVPWPVGVQLLHEEAIAK